MSGALEKKRLGSVLSANPPIGIVCDPARRNRKALDLTGEVVGRLTVIRLLTRKRSSFGKLQYLWECQCTCGKMVIKPTCTLRAGTTKSCGCWSFEHAKGKAYRKTHGHTCSRTTQGFVSKTYASWSAMHTRCRNPKQKTYSYYGGRGVTVCESWNTFENFLKDMGERPEGKTLDRIDCNGNYSPENCKWSTHAEQSRNTRVRKLDVAKVRCILIDPRANGVIAKEYGVSSSLICAIKNRRAWKDIEEDITDEHH